MEKPTLTNPDTHTHEGLLLVWNPVNKPETIQAHVDSFRKNAKAILSANKGGETPPSNKRSYTWWGRFRGRNPATREVINQRIESVKDKFDGKVSEEHPIVVFITNYVSVHALLVDEIRFPQSADDAPQRGEYPDYYDRELPDGASTEGDVALWLRVRDIRVLSHDSLTTLHYLSEHVTYQHPESHTFAPYDPYSSAQYVYPLIVQGPPLDDVFAPDRPQPCAFDADVSYPLIELEMRQKLEERLGQDTWQRMDSTTRNWLINASIHMPARKTQKAKLEARDLLSPFRDLTTALEIELVHGVFHELLKKEGMEALRDGVRKQNGKYAATLGVVVYKYDDLLQVTSATFPEVNATLQAMSKDNWLHGLKEMRNMVVHGTGTPKLERLKKRIDRMLASDEKAAQFWRALIEAKQAVSSEK